MFRYGEQQEELSWDEDKGSKIGKHREMRCCLSMSDRTFGIKDKLRGPKGAQNIHFR